MLRAGLLVLLLTPAAAEGLAGRHPVEAFLGPGAKASVPVAEILHGGPPVDGIPALSRPKRHGAKAADAFLRGGDEVLGLALGGEAVAYPIRLLNWHEIVNDEVGGVPVAVTYCPLCRSGVVFEARVGGAKTEFGVSGLLYKSDLVLYDRATRSLWSQIRGEAIVGPSLGAALARLPATHTDWARWKERHPRTTAVGFDTGHARDYGRDPYEGYGESRAVYFPAGPKDERLHPKEVVFGVSAAGAATAARLSLLREKRVLRARLGARRVTFKYEEGPRAYGEDGAEIPGLTAYWFAWAAFHPRTRLVGGGS